MERRDLDDAEARITWAIREQHRLTRLEVRAVGLVPAILAAILASLLTTGAVMFMWGIIRL